MKSKTREDRKPLSPPAARGASETPSDGATNAWFDSLATVIEHTLNTGGTGARTVAAGQTRRPAAGRRPAFGLSAEYALCQHHPGGPAAAVSRATAKSSGASRAMFVGTRWRWSSTPTATISGLGGHISTYASAPRCTRWASIISFTAATAIGRRTWCIFQGHASPGIYARAFLEGRLDEAASAPFPPGTGRRRRAFVVSASVPDAGFLAVPDRVDGAGADHVDLSGAVQPLSAGARVRHRARSRKSGLLSATARPTNRKRSARSRWPSRENLDNLVWVVNCNLQRLDGPVRGNGKIIQELEAAFRGAGLERHQGHLGLELGPAAGGRQDRAARQAHGRSGGWRLPEIFRRTRQLHAQTFLRQISRTARVGQSSDATSRFTSCCAAATTPQRFTPPTRPRWSTRASRR